MGQCAGPVTTKGIGRPYSTCTRGAAKPAAALHGSGARGLGAGLAGARTGA